MPHTHKADPGHRLSPPLGTATRLNRETGHSIVTIFQVWFPDVVTHTHIRPNAFLGPFWPIMLAKHQGKTEFLSVGRERWAEARWLGRGP